ncbi:FG-GAP repeat domain-containing protein [Streptomyces sp. NBC_01353]|uniref:FG-GAP repeat domain-containing protein n=1 Tax=Streptomyces sp. NBC_01353 TaxID=2903835 RepID=UPI002E35B887|nr:VCBS repeat-containing protein [Streptomyces sp. NBC_01353]
MSHARPARRQLAAAVVTVLAVTVGSTALAAPAIAVPATEATTGAAETTTSVAPFLKNSTIIGAGATGYLALTKTAPTGEEPYAQVLYWVPADGSTATEINWSAKVESTGSGDIVASNWATGADLTDMATGQKLASVSLGGESETAYAGAAGKALFTTLFNENGDRITHMHSTTSGSAMMTAGLPGDAYSVRVTPGTADHALLTYSTQTGTSYTKYAATLDLATNTVTETYELPKTHGDLAVSATHLAWVEYDAAANVTVVVVDRATKAAQNFKAGSAGGRDVEVGLVGDWVTYGTRSGLESWAPDALNALTARSLKDGTTTRKLLDHTLRAAVAPDGAQVVRGGTVEQGEGLYRIAPGIDGIPAATLVASSGESTPVALLGSNVPAVIDLDQNRGQAQLGWTLSRYNVRATVTLRHVRTGKTISQEVIRPTNGVVRFDWKGDLGHQYETAYNGDYTWQISAEPLNGIGPVLTSSGTFKAVRKPAPHDYNDNGTPDVLLRDGSGRIWRADSHFAYYNPWLASAEQKLIGSGWNIYNQIEAAGNIAGAAHADLVARDKDGVLWHFLGKGDGTFAPRYKISAGLGGYNKIAAGSDLNGDAKPDLVATDTAGAMWLYKGTGSWSAPFTTRVKIGTGWQGYNQITATGNIAGAPAGDLVARDTAGVLWLYLGKGDGTFAPRIKIGAGWGGYSHLVGIGDADRDGRPDLVATNASDTNTYLYKGTGSWSAPFGQRQATSLPNNRPTSVA